jgi:hypothetical protein
LARHKSAIFLILAAFTIKIHQPIACNVPGTDAGNAYNKVNPLTTAFLALLPVLYEVLRDTLHDCGALFRYTKQGAFFGTRRLRQCVLHGADASKPSAYTFHCNKTDAAQAAMDTPPFRKPYTLFRLT